MAIKDITQTLKLRGTHPTMSIQHWPKEDRPVEKLFSHGAHLLTDAELVAILLKTGLRGKTALDLAKELLTQYAGLKNLIQQPLAVLLKHAGLGSIKIATLKAAVEMGKRYLQTSEVDLKSFKNIPVVEQFLLPDLCDQVNEVFACLFLTTRLELIRYEHLFVGTINETNIYIREIVRRCIQHNAAKVILAHNHPSGSTHPSSADKEVTQLIKQALDLIDTEVIDHIIVGKTSCFSFAKANLL